MAGTRGAFGSIARGRGALKKRARALVLFVLLLAACAMPEPTTINAVPAPINAVPATLPAPAGPSPGAVGPERYQGLRGAELVQLLGTPDFRRRDAGAEIWQYRAGACILDLFLYEDGGAFHVIYAETRSRATGRACNEALVEGQAAEARL
jgi:hypothetical protein